MSACGAMVANLLYAREVPYDTLTNGSNPMTGGLDIPAEGVAVAVAQSSASSTFGWTGITERVDEVVQSSVLSHSMAADEFVTPETNRTLTATPSSYTAGVICAASFRRL